MVILILLTSFIGLAIAAWLWGVDSSDKIDSPEWERRRYWPSQTFR